MAHPTLVFMLLTKRVNEVQVRQAWVIRDLSRNGPLTKHAPTHILNVYDTVHRCEVPSKRSFLRFPILSNEGTVAAGFSTAEGADDREHDMKLIVNPAGTLWVRMKTVKVSRIRIRGGSVTISVPEFSVRKNLRGGD